MSAYENMMCISVEAGSDLSSSQFLLVAMASDGQVDACGNGARALGVLQDDPAAAGRAGTVCIGGRTKVKAGAAVAVGALIGSDAAGKAVTAASGDVVLGVAMSAASADGEIISMVFAPGHLVA
jgi:hypothetical protein